MILNIINLIDNFNKFNNLVINQYPLASQNTAEPQFSSCNEILKNTQSCLIFEQKPSCAIKLFNILLEKGRKGIIITRNHPEKICTNLATKKIDMYWLSSEDIDYAIHPWETRLLIETVGDFIDQDNRGVILLNGLEYLSTYNESNIVLDVFYRIVELVARTEGKLLITIDPIALGNKFINNIENNSEIIVIQPL